MIGLGLILGCFTRVASAAGMLVILLFYLCNPLLVGYFYSIPMEGSYLVVNKNLVEMAALFVVLVTNSGRARDSTGSSTRLTARRVVRTAEV